MSVSLEFDDEVDDGLSVDLDTSGDDIDDILNGDCDEVLGSFNHAVDFDLIRADAKRGGMLFYDLETIPDESRFPRPEILSLPGVFDSEDHEKTKIDDLKSLIPSMPVEELDKMEKFEGLLKKPRKGVLEFITRTLKDRSEAFGKWSKQCSTNPLKCRIVGFGYAIGYGGDVRTFTASNEKEEKDILSAFWILFADPGRKRCGYNIVGFDDAVVAWRSMILRIAFSRPMSRKKYNNKDVLDIQNHLFPSGLSEAQKAKTVAQALGIDIPAKGVEGSQVLALYEAGDFEGIAAYVGSDVHVEREILKRSVDIFID